MSSELHLCSDEEMARQAQAGSLTAFEELVFRYERRIYGFVVQFCPNAADAAELTQETFVKAFRSIASYNGRHAFPGWLFTIARHKCIDHYRAAPPQSDAPVPDCSDGSDPAAELSMREDRDNLWALARRVLPAAQFQALWLAYAEDLQVKDIARVMGRTVTHIKVMLFRARRTLRRALEQSRPGFLSIEPDGARSGSARRPAAHSPLRVVRPWAFPAEPTQARAAGKLGPL